jgi:hypothetical protein
VAIFEIFFSFFFLKRNTNGEIHGNTLSGFSPESIISGLHFVIILAAFLYGLALIFSVLTPEKRIIK